MKILVLSDSHAGLSFMRACIRAVKPDAVVHLGDYYDDGQTIAEEYPHLPFYRVPGNCDRFRCAPWHPAVLVDRVCGVELFMTHGHIHRVKSGIGGLLKDAREARVQAALYGHTHIADCHREADGLWVLNPGTCGSWGGSAGVMEVNEGKIVDCRIIRQENLEEMV